MVRSLIIDPRVCDEDYLFFGDDDPFAGPPLNFNYLGGDINTGLLYRETYRQRVTNPAKQILLPIQVYTDGCATGQFTNLNITQLKIALGIHNAEARDLDYLWRDLIFIPHLVDTPRHRISLYPWSEGTVKGQRHWRSSAPRE